MRHLPGAQPVTRRHLVIGLLLLWTALWLASFLAPVLTAPTGDGFTRGMNRVSTFAGLQFCAGLIALGLLALRPSAGRLRWLSLVPAALAALLILGILGLILWAWLAPYPALSP